MTKDLAAEVVAELAKQLPIKDAYEDALSPGMKQVGSIGESLLKTVHLALAPIQWTAALQDRYAKFLDSSVRRVPEDQRIEPPPQILGPVLEGVRYEANDTPISDMFSELLSRGFDSKRVNEAHPSYPALIRQLSEDEARLLSAIYSREVAKSFLRFEFTLDYNGSTNQLSNRKIEVDEVPRGALRFPENTDFYMERLGVLGLVAVLQIGNQEILTDAENRQTGVRVRNHVRLSPSGIRFMKAVSKGGLGEKCTFQG